MIEALKQQIKTSPSNSGVYQFFDENDKALYVGKAKNLKKRLSNYTDPKRLSVRILRMTSLAKKIEIIITASEAEALLLECNLIKKLMPRYNILLRDDKSFPYIMISRDHEFGQLTKHRGKKIQKAYYFGPFASVSATNETIDILKKSFLLRSCSDSEFKSRKKPCLEYQIKRCSAPCTNLISKADYNELLHEAVDFLGGKNAKIQEDLAQKMQGHSQNFNYEKAAIIRDRIKALSTIQAKQNINIAALNNSDVITLVRSNNLAAIYISFYRNGHNYGGKTYFMNVNDDESEAEIMSAFLGQFYLDQELPKSLILSHEPEECDGLSAALNLVGARHAVPANNIEILIPQKGEKFSLIQDQLKTTAKNLAQKLESQIKDKEMLLELKKLFDLPKIPERIEVYDNSHISGEHMVGALIASGLDGFIKNGYRKFNIRINELENHDDTALLKQVLRRRFKNFGADEMRTQHAVPLQITEMTGSDPVGTQHVAPTPNVKTEIYPDFIIIDGGKGQLSAAAEIFSELQINIPFVCMSKGPDRNAGEECFHAAAQELDPPKQGDHLNPHRSAAQEPVLKSRCDELEMGDLRAAQRSVLSVREQRSAENSSFTTIANRDFGKVLTLPKHSPLMHYLQRLRDEAHRFAIGTHRAKRDKALVQSELDEISGIGSGRKKLLLNHFGSVKQIKEAALEDLERVKGINKNIAEKVWQFFNEK